jgi:hypothetical protein
MIQWILIILLSFVSSFVPTLHRHATVNPTRIRARNTAVRLSNETSTDTLMDMDDSAMSLHVPTWTNSVPSLDSSGYVRTVHSIREFLEFVDQPDMLCVVKFHANYCKICSRTILKYKKMAGKSIKDV